MKPIFFPNKYNYLVWANALFLLALLLYKKVTPISIVFAYFLETIIIGLFHCVKLWMVNTHGKKSNGKVQMPSSSLGIVLFFMAHYGLFVAVQSIFLFSFFQNTLPDLKDGFHLIHNYGVILKQEGMTIVLASLFVSNLKYFYTNFWQNDQYKDYSPSAIFFKPYVRIFIQQFTVILAGFFFIVFSEGFAAAILLIVFRLIVDLIIIGIHRDANHLDTLLRKITKNETDFQKAKEQLKEISE
ncbi:MAG: DUF6498-containing protein [Flavobacteriaceae bacterium]